MIRPERPQMRWDYQRPRHPTHNSHNPQWRHPAGPRIPFRGHTQRFMHHRPAFQPGNDNYWCETCDRGFPTKEILDKHMQQHQKCNIDGCQFIAHPKVITKHIQMQHSTGLYKKIANIKNPEDIEKWREERRRKYPTKTNIEKKAAELKEKINRGEKMGLEGKRNHHNSYNSAQNRGNNNSEQGLKRRNNLQNKNQPHSKYIKTNTDNNHQKKAPQITKPKIFPIVQETKKLEPFAGIQNLQMDSDNDVEDDIIITETNIAIEDDEYLEESKRDVSKPVVDTVEPVVCGALSSLICDYASSDEESPKEVVSKIIPKNHVNQTSKSNQDKKNESILKINEYSETAIHNSTNSSLQAIKSKDEVTKEYTETAQNQKNEDCEEAVQSTSELKNIQANGNDDSGPEEVNTEVHKQDVTSTENDKPKVNLKKRVPKGKKLPLQHPKRKLPSTLLHKLLFKEMQQERNIILQCIRYIKNNNYFDIK